jgi:hypothetical protein
LRRPAAGKGELRFTTLLWVSSSPDSTIVRPWLWWWPETALVLSTLLLLSGGGVWGFQVKMST